jgi:Icc protein
MRAGSADTLKLVQLSDCHVSSDPDAEYRGQNAARSLERLLPAVRGFGPDLLLLTGDVSEDGGAASYKRVSSLLDTLDTPVLAIPGNHDDPAEMQKHFLQGPWSGPLLYEWKNWLMVLLDSTAPGVIGGVFSDTDLKALQTALDDSAADHVLIALHHQPVAVGSPWIDKYALGEAEVFMDVVENDSRVRCVAWGHVHQDFSVQRGGVKLLGSPSSVANGIPGREKFTLDEAGPACRWLMLDREGGVETGLLRP